MKSSSTTFSTNLPFEQKPITSKNGSKILINTDDGIFIFLFLFFFFFFFNNY